MTKMVVHYSAVSYVFLAGPWLLLRRRKVRVTGKHVMVYLFILVARRRCLVNTAADHVLSVV